MPFIYDADILRAHAERLRMSGALGRSPLLQRLFDFLLECSIAGRAPKEIEVAMDVFGKGAGFDVSQDAMVRVYVHKLRRKLEEFYAEAGGAEPTRLVIPKGEYRFVVESGNAPGAEGAARAPLPAAPVLEPPRAPPARGWRTGLLIALLVALLVNAAVLLAAWLHPAPPRDELAAIRQSPLWAPILDDDRPIFIVVGDYYIFGETDPHMEVKRLIREFSINSPQDLDEFMQLHPEVDGKYLDLELAYLPTAAAYALRDVMPVLANANRRVRVVTMSQLNPGVIKSTHVIYIGYLSGLGRLKDLVFASSRLQFGDSYDEIVDRKTQQHYVSQAAVPYRGESKFHDYGYIASFAGPEGARILVLAGTRDVATMHMAETLTNPKLVDSLLRQAASPTRNFEALYEVYGLDRLNLDGKLLLASPLDPNRIWADGRGPR